MTIIDVFPWIVFTSIVPLLAVSCFGVGGENENMEQTPKNVHALVHLLKSPLDPPNPDGPLKIDFASQAWSDPSFCAANKARISRRMACRLTGVRWEEVRRLRVLLLDLSSRYIG